MTVNRASKKPAIKKKSTNREHNFSATVVREIAVAAMYVCSNPSCNRLTGASNTEGKPRTIAEAAHITPASPKGPRAGHQTTVDPKSAENGIWLCSICHTTIDGDVSAYPVDKLNGWKNDHQELIRSIVGKDLEMALLTMNERRRYHAEARHLIALLDDHRFGFGPIGLEQPRYVLQAVQTLRQKIQDLRGKITGPHTTLAITIEKLQGALHNFMNTMDGPNVNLDKLKWGDPDWLSFADALEILRQDMYEAVLPLSEEEKVEFLNF